MAEREGFEPPCRLPDKTLSRRPRYDHFGTSPNKALCRYVLLAAGREELLHQPAALGLEHAAQGGHPVVQGRMLMSPHD